MEPLPRSSGSGSSTATEPIAKKQKTAEPTRYDLVSDGCYFRILGAPGGQGAVFRGMSAADFPKEVAVKVFYEGRKADAEKEAVRRRPLDRLRARRRHRTAPQADYPARQAMLVAANGGLNADGAHLNILGLVDPSEYPLVTVHPLVGAPVGREKIGFVTAPGGKKFECSPHAVVLPIAKGDALLDYVVKYGAETRREGVARHFFKQMVDGTRRLHALGIAHLDLKLENMLLSAESSDATLMISDFGLSRKVGSTGRCDAEVTEGSAHYLAPEVDFPTAFAVNDDNTNAFAVDVWTLGVCLATLVIGFEIFNAGHFTKRKHVVFTEMRAAQESGGNGLRAACSASRYSATALGKFNWPGETPRPGRLPASLTRLLDSMLRVKPEDRPTLADVAKDPWVAGIPEPPAAPPAVDAPQHRSLAATAPAYKSLAAADEPEVPRYNACSAAPPAAPSAAFRGLSADEAEEALPPIGRCNVSRLVRHSI